MRVKLACLAGALTLGLSSIASAADLPARGPVYKAPAAVPAFSWTGCYIGGFAGGAFPHNDATSRDLNGYNYGGAVGPA
jgi:outer membrane immunogenic protein